VRVWRRDGFAPGRTSRTSSSRTSRRRLRQARARAGIFRSPATTAEAEATRGMSGFSGRWSRRSQTRDHGRQRSPPRRSGGQGTGKAQHRGRAAAGFVEIGDAYQQAVWNGPDWMNDILDEELSPEDDGGQSPAPEPEPEPDNGPDMG
jgi:hypothetical protein